MPDFAAPTLEHTFTERFPDLSRDAAADIPATTRVTWVNSPLAAELGLERAFAGAADGALQFLTGGAWEGASTPLRSLAYSGHQFGNLSPILGDGRAHLVGEVAPSDRLPQAPALAGRTDLHLKGSGRTPFSRPGSDGKAPLTAMWREAVIGEALHGLGIPTSRALAVLETGEVIRRRGPEPEPAGIVVRAAASHLRVGTFQFAQLHAGAEVREALVDYALERHYPHLNRGDQPPALALLRAVALRQADLVAQWMGAGFIHGVLNTDNVGIAGESIDFGPCAFMDQFSHAQVFSSIDDRGRYSYRNQPAVTQWNLARFAETLLDLINPDDPNAAVEEAQEVLAGFEARYREAWGSVFAGKLGIGLGDAVEPAAATAGVRGPEKGADGSQAAAVSEFAARTLDLLDADSIDFTTFFRALTDDPGQVRALTRIQASADSWLGELRRLREQTNTDPEQSQALMEASNPVYVPRNMPLEHALHQAARGDASTVLEIIECARAPFTRRPGPVAASLETAPRHASHFTTFCGT